MLRFCAVGQALASFHRGWCAAYHVSSRRMGFAWRQCRCLPLALVPSGLVCGALSSIVYRGIVAAVSVPASASLLRAVLTVYLQLTSEERSACRAR